LPFDPGVIQMLVSRTSRRALLAGAGLLLLQMFHPANADTNVALGARVGTVGAGLEFDVGNESFAGRFGYSFLNYDYTLDDTDISYDTKLKINNASLLVDWYVASGSFHLSLGGMGGGVKLGTTGRPTRGTYELNGTLYSGTQVGSITGEIKFGNSLAPYVGVGWGNPVGEAGRVRVLFDVGALYGGTPSVTLNVTCGAAAPQGSAQCGRLQQDALAERRDLEDNVGIARWYPVINFGVSYRF
jgi:hypothetical protein